MLDWRILAGCSALYTHVARMMMDQSAESNNSRQLHITQENFIIDIIASLQLHHCLFPCIICRLLGVVGAARARGIMRTKHHTSTAIEVK